MCCAKYGMWNIKVQNIRYIYKIWKIDAEYGRLDAEYGMYRCKI
jgi:hypothetical protein